MYYNKKMLEIQFPGKPVMQINSVLCDINGTLSLDGQLLEGVSSAVAKLKNSLTFYLLSANTAGTAAEIANVLGVDLKVIQPGHEARQKELFLSSLGAGRTIAIGQGANDELILKKAAIGICVLSQEGTSVKALNAADIVVPNILTAFELIQKPTRIVATLRQ